MEEHDIACPRAHNQQQLRRAKRWRAYPEFRQPMGRCMSGRPFIPSGFQYFKGCFFFSHRVRACSWVVVPDYIVKPDPKGCMMHACRSGNEERVREIVNMWGTKIAVRRSAAQGEPDEVDGRVRGAPKLTSVSYRGCDVRDKTDGSLLLATPVEASAIPFFVLRRSP